MARPKPNYSNTIIPVSFSTKRVIYNRLEEKRKDLGLNRSEYINLLIIKDLGYDETEQDKQVERVAESKG